MRLISYNMLTNKKCHLRFFFDARKLPFMSEENEREAENAQILAPTEVRVPDYAGLARMIVREGKSFRTSAVKCGYAVSTAARGAKALAADSKPFADAYKRETELVLKEAERDISLAGLKPLAVARLHAEITNSKSSLGIKAIELAGRFKETDWFVRNTEVQIGVFAGLGEPDAIDVGTYEEKPSNEP